MRPIALAICLFSAAALAYVIPATSILNRMTKEEDKIQVFSWKIEGALSFFGPAAKEAAAALKLTAEGNELQVDGVVSLKHPGRCRFDASSAEGATSSAVTTNGKARTEGSPLPTLQLTIDEICALMVQRSGDEGVAKAAVERHLSKLGVDTKRSSLGRIGTDVAYVVGDPAAGKSQLFVNKDSFTPARILFTDAAGQKWDLRFHDFYSPLTGDQFPRVTEVWKNGELQLRFTALKAEPKAQFADKVF
jgi:hypothetical protein